MNVCSSRRVRTGLISTGIETNATGEARTACPVDQIGFPSSPTAQDQVSTVTSVPIGVYL